MYEYHVMLYLRFLVIICFIILRLYSIRHNIRVEANGIPALLHIVAGTWKVGAHAEGRRGDKGARGG